MKNVKNKYKVKILKAGLYKDCKVIIRQIGRDYFEYLLTYNGEIYSSYIIIKPEKGRKELTEEQITSCMQVINAGAEATIDELIGDVQVDQKTRDVLKLIEANKDKIENHFNNGK